ncbi:glycosyltransferase family 4 protein [Methylophilus sp. Leaf408]|uniref:glycosyltransferase family 4 protein n=1 Tax=Methylophilus sp. Leaf408 TaxID=2876561 RepID=UPI001E56B9E6|nr:glycosyltransferase family 4 protein [Methylophilus sp. Leaf408]
MKVLIVSQYFWPESFRINEVARDLKQSGHEVEVLTGKPNYPEGVFYQGYSGVKTMQELWNDIPVHRLPMVARGQNNKYKLVLNYLSFIVSGLLFGPFLLRKRQFDVIFVYAPSPIFQVIPASFIGWLKKIPVVLWVQDLWPQSVSATGHIESKLALRLLEKAVSFAYRHTDLLLVQSEAFIPQIKRLSTPDTPVKYLPNSVDDTFLNPAAQHQASIKALETGFNVMFAGNIGSAQAIETIVEAAEKLNSNTQIKFVVLGRGSKLEWLKAQISSRNLNNIVLAGHHPVEAMPHLLRQASALLVTLAKQPIFELTIPSKVQAYLASGKPVIACLDGEGARVIREAQAGLTVPAENAALLVEAVMKLYETQQNDLEQMGLNGQNYFKMHFQHHLVMNSLISYLQAAIQQKQGR